MAEIGVIGSGSWGTALALVLNKNGHHVTIWSYLKEEAEEKGIVNTYQTITGGLFGIFRLI